MSIGIGKYVDHCLLRGVMRALLWVCLAVATWSSTFALFYDKTEQIFQPPTSLRNYSYFGYSITYDGSYKRLVISAPRTDFIGDVYECSINKNTCSAINRSIVTREPKIANYTHDFWFGATVKAGPNFVMMCAPRYTEYTVRKLDQYNSTSKQYYGFDANVARGSCYSLKGTSLTKRKPIDEKERVTDSASTMEATMDSFGWSIDVASDDSVVVGGPGMYHGRAMFYSQLTYRVPEFIRYDSHVPKFNFGYAIATGTFINERLSYAISSTYRFGEVTFYKNYKTYQKTLVNPYKMVGTMFGAVLCAARMSGSRTDLLVGAPTYGIKDKYEYDLGAVYVFLASGATKDLKFKRIIVGKVSGSMFGSAIINVGDFNNDKKHEIAIGAPFENSGQGVVYLYSGADLISDQTEKTLKPLQVIKPKASYGLSFGMSLTPLLDYDQNGCKEIAIGSPYTDTVVLLRCMASVIVKTAAHFDMESFQNRTISRRTDFEFNVCLLVNYTTLPKKITGRIKTTVEMVHEDAKLANSTGRFVFETSLDMREPKYCNKVPFILPIDGKYDTEIIYNITSELLDDPRNLPSFDASRVILSDRSVLSVYDKLWVAECSGSKVCVPKLELSSYSISFKNDLNKYIIGSSPTETMSVTVKNSGDVAYSSCVRIHIAGVTVFKPGSCAYETSAHGDILKCEPSKPLQNGKNMNTGLIELEMSHLTNLYKSINITIYLYNRCNEAATENRTITIPVEADYTGINAKGETDIGNIVDMKEEDIKNNGKYFRHIYKIKNDGLTNWEELDVLVTLQLQSYINYISYDNVSVRIFSYPTSSNIPCTEEITTDTTTFYRCTVKSLRKNLEYSQILIPIYVLPNTLDDTLTKEQNITITSSIKMMITKDIVRSESVNTTLVLKDASVPIQTIIIGVVVGLCILIIIAVVLYRVGFLRRKRKEELDKLKKSVKRQTILRRSTMPSQNQTAEDRRQILEGMKEEDEHEQAPNI